MLKVQLTFMLEYKVIHFLKQMIFGKNTLILIQYSTQLPMCYRDNIIIPPKVLQWALCNDLVLLLDDVKTLQI